MIWLRGGMIPVMLVWFQRPFGVFSEWSGTSSRCPESPGSESREDGRTSSCAENLRVAAVVVSLDGQ